MDDYKSPEFVLIKNVLSNTNQYLKSIYVVKYNAYHEGLNRIFGKDFRQISQLTATKLI